MQIVAYGAQDVCLGSFEELRFHRGYSTVIYKGKYKQFTGKHNFYEHIKKPGNKTSRKYNRINIRERGPIIDEYDGLKNNSRYITAIDTSRCPNIFNSDKVYISKGIYVNNKRKYRNFELLFQYSKSDHYQYLTNSLNDILKTKI